MTPPNVAPRPLAESLHRAAVWDVGVPFTVAAIPVVAFTLMGLLTPSMDGPNAEPPLWSVIVLGTLELLGIIAMATVILLRFEHTNQKLSRLAQGRPAIWRKAALLLSLSSLLLFDLFLNVAAAFTGTKFLVIAAVPMFFAYLVCHYLTFAGLRRRHAR